HAAQARDESLSPHSSGGLRAAGARRSRSAQGDCWPDRSPRAGESAALRLSPAVRHAARTSAAAGIASGRSNRRRSRPATEPSAVHRGPPMTAQRVTLNGGWAGFEALDRDDVAADTATTELTNIL